MRPPKKKSGVYAGDHFHRGGYDDHGRPIAWLVLRVKRGRVKVRGAYGGAHARRARWMRTADLGTRIRRPGDDD